MAASAPTTTVRGAAFRRRRRRVPATQAGGVGPIGLGVSMMWLSLIVMLPLAAVLAKALEDGPSGFVDAIDRPATRAALTVTLVMSLIVAYRKRGTHA